MFKMKAIAISCVSVLTASVMLAGCGKSDTTPATSSAPADSAVAATAAPSAVALKDVTLTFLANQDQVHDPLTALAKKFEGETGITIDFQIVPSDQFSNLLNTKLNSKEGPDLWMDQGGKFRLASKAIDAENNLVDLTAEPWTATLKPIYAEHVTANKKVVGLPYWDLGASTSWVYMYNKQIFTKLNLAVPKTFDEFLVVLQKIKDAGITPIYEPGADGWHQQLPVFEMGPRIDELSPGIYDKLNLNQVKLADDPNAVKLMDQINQLVVKGYYGKDYMSQQNANNYAAIGSQKFAITLDHTNFGTEMVNAVKDTALKAEDIGAFVMPFLDNQTINVNPQGPSIFVYKPGAHVEEAKQFIAYLAKPENLQYYLDNDAKFSDLPYTGLKAKSNPVVDELMTVAQNKLGTVMQSAVNYIDPQWIDTGKDVVTLFFGKTTPKDVWANVDKRREQQAKANQDPSWK
jgi:raffinose/stachyose/melibiose transport system substrate-binding protein